MPKQRSTYSGLSRFALEAFGASQVESSSSQAEEAKPNAASNAKNPAKSEDSQTTSSASEPPVKKRKIGLLGIGREKIDATGLVPYYTEQSEVPDHLRKCA